MCCVYIHVRVCLRARVIEKINGLRLFFVEVQSTLYTPSIDKATDRRAQWNKYIHKINEAIFEEKKFDFKVTQFFVDFSSHCVLFGLFCYGYFFTVEKKF